MTHQVSQTMLRRRDHFDEGETRQAFDASAIGAHLTAGDLLDRVRALASTVSASAAQVRNADLAQPFTIPAFAPSRRPSSARTQRPRHGHARRKSAPSSRPMARGDGNPCSATPRMNEIDPSILTEE